MVGNRLRLVKRREGVEMNDVKVVARQDRRCQTEAMKGEGKKS